MSPEKDQKFMNRAVAIARASEREGDLPTGAVVTLAGEVIGEGKSAVLQPVYNPGNHAEILALQSVDPALWPRALEMTCYTTVEPCVMCAGNLLLHGIGRVVFGARDPHGGAQSTLEHLPPLYDDSDIYEWIGPVMPDVCDPFRRRMEAAFEELPMGRNPWAGRDDQQPSIDVDELFEKLDAWRTDNSDALSIGRVRELIAEVSNRLEEDRRFEVLPYAKTLFERTGYRKDFRLLKRYARRAGAPEVIDDVQASIRCHLPDIWIRRSLQTGNREAAIDCWYEHEGHRRMRHCADEMVAACDEDDVELIISCRMSSINYLIGRRARRHYRRACAVLRKLRDELEQAGEANYWHFVIEDIRQMYGNRPALLDELKRAAFIEDQ